MKIGYARVSTDDHNKALRLDALTAAGCGRIFTDEASGASIERAGLTAALDAVNEGDTLIVWKLDGLVRSVRQIVPLLDGLRGRGVTCPSITKAVDTTSSYGRAVWQIVAVMAELERGLIVERTRGPKGRQSAGKASRTTPRYGRLAGAAGGRPHCIG